MPPFPRHLSRPALICLLPSGDMHLVGQENKKRGRGAIQASIRLVVMADGASPIAHKGPTVPDFPHGMDEQ